MLNFLYTLIIFPIEQLLGVCYTFVFRISQNPGLSIIGLSILVSTIILPLSFIAEKQQQAEREKQKQMQRMKDNIKAVFKGDKRFMMLSTLYRQHNYHPVYALRSSLGLFIQIPFFIAAWHFLNNLELLNGHAFLFIKDLGVPDRLLGGGINLLPILMTLINIVSGVIYTKDLARQDKIQVYGISVLFLVLLYNSPAALVLYWTCNNIYNLVKNMLFKTKKVIQINYRLLLFFTAIKKVVIRNMYTVLTAFFIAFTACIYIPFVSYFRNVNEFVFTGTELFGLMLVPAIVMFCLSLILLEVAILILPKTQVMLFSSGIRISIFNVFILLLIMCICIEGSFLSRGLPQLTGEAGLFLSKQRMITSTAVWCFIILFGLFFWKKLAKKSLSVYFALFILMTAGIADAYISKDVKLPIHATRHKVLNAINFHPNDNIIILLIDSVPTDAALFLLDKKPEIFNAFNGFTLFRNNLATGGSTLWAMPAILGGKIYSGELYKEFAQNALSSPDSLLQIFGAKGYDIYYSSVLPNFNVIFNNATMVKQETASLARMNMSSYLAMLFPFIPYIFKEKAASYLSKIITGEIFVKIENLKINYPLTDENIFRHYLAPKLETRSSPNPTLHYHHFHGVHPPFREYNDDGEPLPFIEGFHRANKRTFLLISEFLEELKRHELYDDAIIVVIADHGITGVFEPPSNSLNHNHLSLFMVKPRQARGPLVISDVPFSSAYMVSLLRFLHNDAFGALECFYISLPETRYVLLPPDRLARVDGNDPRTASVSFLELNRIYFATTTIKMNTNYRLGFDDGTITNIGFAAPIFDEGFFDFNRALGFCVRSREAVLVFSLDTDSKFVTITFNAMRFDEWDGRKPFPLVITDMFTGKELYKTDNFLETPGSSEKIVLQDVSVKEGKIHLYFSSKPNDGIHSSSWIMLKDIMASNSTRGIRGRIQNLLNLSVGEINPFPMPIVHNLYLIKKALEAYYQVNNAYPVSQGWDGLYSNWGYSGVDWITGLVPEFLPYLPRERRNLDNDGSRQYLYWSDGRDFKLISNGASELDMSYVRRFFPELIDPRRPNSAFGFWTIRAMSR